VRLFDRAEELPFFEGYEIATAAFGLLAMTGATKSSLTDYYRFGGICLAARFTAP